MKQLLENILNYLFPIYCCNCQNLLSSDGLVCHECWAKLRFISEPICIKCGTPFELNIVEHSDAFCPQCIAKTPKYNSARSIMVYDDVSRKIIHNFKYYDKTQLAKHFAKIALSNYAKISENEVIIPVPMHRLKRLFRLYNPAQILAQQIAKQTRIPCKNNILVKIKWSKPQSKLSRRQRIRNLRGSFAINNAQQIQGKKILLVDDVITTGTTSEICAALLKKAGASEVNILSIARTVLTH